MKRSEAKAKFLAAAYELTRGSREITRPLVVEAAERAGLPVPAWFVNDRKYRVAWGKYRLPANGAAADPKPVTVRPAPVAVAAAPVTPPPMAESAPVTQSSFDLAVMSGEATLEALLGDGRATAEGDLSILATLAGLMVEFDPRFEIMPGTKLRTELAAAEPFEGDIGAVISE